MPINFLPVILAGAAILLLGKRKRSPTKQGEKALPQASGRGTVFDGDTDSTPSVISANVGERFSVTFMTNPSVPGNWKLKASPPDDSVKHVQTDHDEVQFEGVGGISGKDVYIFEAVKPGNGSLVFHWQQPWLEGKEPPAKISEILTEISSTL